MPLVRREIRKTPNPYAKPLGRKTPEQLNREKPDLMALVNQDRKTKALEESRAMPATGGTGLGPALYDVGFGETGLPVMIPVKPPTPGKN